MAALRTDHATNVRTNAAMFIAHECGRLVWIRVTRHCLESHNLLLSGWSSETGVEAPVLTAGPEVLTGCEIAAASIFTGSHTRVNK